MRELKGERDREWREMRRVLVYHVQSYFEKF